MILFVFDTETNGLPTSWGTSNRGWHQHWPSPVQISWLMYNTNQNEIISKEDHIILLDEPIDKDAVKIHGISEKRMFKEGESLRIVLRQFRKDIECADIIIAHNINFDYHVISRSCIQECIPDIMSSSIIKDKRLYCTMKEGTPLCNIMQKHKYTGEIRVKYPTLQELHSHLFQDELNDAYLHNSLYDILVTLRCVCKMLYNVDLFVVCEEYIDMMEDIILPIQPPSPDILCMEDSV